ARVHHVVVVSPGSRFLARDREVLASRHAELVPAWRPAVSAKRRTRKPHSCDFSVTYSSPCVTSCPAGRPRGAGRNSMRAGFRHRTPEPGSHRLGRPTAMRALRLGAIAAAEP